jgi:hypothetical protein
MLPKPWLFIAGLWLNGAPATRPRE